MTILDASGRAIGGSTLRDEQFVALMAEEIRGLEAPAILGLPPADMLTLVAVLQLAMRHPHLADTHRTLCADLVDAGREYFAACPTVLEAIARGDDVEQDVNVLADTRVVDAVIDPRD